MARAWSPSGWRPTGTHIVGFVPEVAAAQVLPDLEANGQAALVFAPPARRAIVPGERRLRGTGARRQRRRARFVRDQWDRWLERLTTIGLPLVDARRLGRVAVRRDTASASRRCSTRRPGPTRARCYDPSSPERFGGERWARGHGLVLPGTDPGGALHLFEGRHAERRVPQSRGLRGSDARGAVVPVLQQEQAQHRREPAGAGAADRPRHQPGWRLGCATSAPKPTGRSSSGWRCASKRSPPTPA